MANKRARISDRNPLTATDGVLAGYEQVNKSTSQVPEVTSPQTKRSTPDRSVKPASQQADQSTSQDKTADASVPFLEAVPTTFDQPASQEVNNLTSQQVNKSTSQQVDEVGLNNLTSQPVSQLASQEVNNLASQEVNEAELDKSRSQQVDQLASQEVNNSASQQVNEAESDKSTSQIVDQPASQQSDNLASQEVSRLESDKSTSQQVDQSASQQANKPTIRKATFQVDAAILADLDRYHLQLQIEMGRRNAPYKEILVEEAIAQWLERAAKSPDLAVKSLIKRQEQR
jgi:hypothetical protein